MGKATKWLLLAKKAFTRSSPRKKFKDNEAVIVPLLESNDVIKEEPAICIEKEIVPVEAAAPEEIDEDRSNVGSEEEEPFPVTPVPSSLTSDEKLRAAVTIQTAFRVFQAKRQLNTLKGLSRLQSIIHGKATKKQTSTAMRSIQSFTKMQNQVRVQRSRMTDVEQQRRQDLEKEKPESEQFCLSPENWDDSTLSKEQIKAKMQIKQRAAIKRERALAYAFSNQQWRTYPTLANEDAEKSNWSWSWLEQWMFTREWEGLEDGGKSPDEKKTTKLPASSSSPTSRKSPVSKLMVPKVVPSKVLSPRLSSPTTPTVLSPKISTPKVSVSSSPKVSSRAKVSPSSPKVLSPKVSTPKVSSPNVSSPKPKVAVGSPLKKLSPGHQQVSSPNRKPTPIQSVTNAGKVQKADENQPRASPGRMHSSVPGTPERNHHLPKKIYAANGRVTSPAMSPKVEKSPRMLP